VDKSVITRRERLYSLLALVVVTSEIIEQTELSPMIVRFNRLLPVVVFINAWRTVDDGPDMVQPVHGRLRTRTPRTHSFTKGKPLVAAESTCVLKVAIVYGIAVLLTGNASRRGADEAIAVMS